MEKRELLEWSASLGITDDPLEKSRRSKSSCLGHSLEISDFPEAGGRGLAAVRDLKKGELILTVPKDALFSVESAKEDPQFVKAWRCHHSLSSTQVLVVYLLSEVAKGLASRWYTYLKSLPQCYHTLAQYSDFEAQALQVENAVWIAERAAEKARKEWEEARPFLQLLGLKYHLSTLKAWLWASATVSSRTLHVPWDDAGTLCPIGDLFNYAPPGAPFKEITVDCFFQNRQNDAIFPELQLHTEKGVLTSYKAADGSVMHFALNDDAGSGLHFTDRLTDGGYDKNMKAYCFYARENYSKGEQVLLNHMLMLLECVSLPNL